MERRRLADGTIILIDDISDWIIVPLHPLPALRSEPTVVVIVERWSCWCVTVNCAQRCCPILLVSLRRFGNVRPLVRISAWCWGCASVTAKNLFVYAPFISVRRHYY